MNTYLFKYLISSNKLTFHLSRIIFSWQLRKWSVLVVLDAPNTVIKVGAVLRRAPLHGAFFASHCSIVVTAPCYLKCQGNTRPSYLNTILYIYTHTRTALYSTWCHLIGIWRDLCTLMNVWLHFFSWKEKKYLALCRRNKSNISLQIIRKNHSNVEIHTGINYNIKNKNKSWSCFVS